jgi:hypothetical protein
VHTVKGTADNGYSSLATLYYGRSDVGAVDLIRAANTNAPVRAAFTVGEKVNIPAYRAPAYYTVPKSAGGGWSADTIASKNGTTGAVIIQFNANTGVTFPAKPGAKVRVK